MTQFGRESAQDPTHGPSHEQGTAWLRGQGPDSDVVMSSRVRLARNLAGFPFMPRATRQDRNQILDLCKTRLLDGTLGERVLWMDLHKADELERNLLVERHLVSKQHAKGRLSNGSGGVEEPRGLAVSLPDEHLSVMVNEEDHLRIQGMRSGLALNDLLNEVDAVDDRIESGLDYAFSPRFGYLTACPTNVGTGVRISVMLHMPALKITGEIEKVKRAANDMSLAVRGFYGEGSESSGDFYQISNQVTLGKSEQVLLHELEREIIPRVIEYERVARRTLMARRSGVLEDQVYRAFGVLTHARLMSAEESMKLLSRVRLGVVLGMLQEVPQEAVNHLVLLTQPAHLQRAVGADLDQDARRRARAELLRNRLLRPSSPRSG